MILKKIDKINGVRTNYTTIVISNESIEIKCFCEYQVHLGLLLLVSGKILLSWSNELGLGV